MQITVPSTFRVIAHRGASGYAPENTLPAFRLAKKMNCSEVECDLQLSADGEVVICHDMNLEKYGHGDSLVEQQTAQYLLNLDMGSWYSPYYFEGTKMLTLQALLAEFGSSFTYHLELKGKAQDLAMAVADIVLTAGLEETCIFTSFRFEQLKRLKEAFPEARMGWLVSEFNEAMKEQARRLELFQLCPKASETTQFMVESMRTVAPEVRAWGLLGEPQEVRTLIQKVVDAGCDGMTINWPDWVRN